MIKKALPWILMIVLFLFMIIGLVFKNDMNDYMSDQMLKQITPQIAEAGNTRIDSLYNYEANGKSYKITFLEFGAKGCSSCRRMEGVMEEIRGNYSHRVNVVFLNIMDAESQILMKYYGISTIPTQVLLNAEGKEYFRHTGFISSFELGKVFQ